MKNRTNEIVGNDIKAGYVAYNGHVFSEADARRYNSYNEDIIVNFNLKNKEKEEFYRSMKAEAFKRIIKVEYYALS